MIVFNWDLLSRRPTNDGAWARRADVAHGLRSLASGLRSLASDFRLLTLLMLAALITACGGSHSSSGQTAAISPSSPIPADVSVPAALTGQSLLADGQQAGDLRVWLASTPPQPVVGNAQVDAFLADSNGQPVSGAKVTYDIDMTNMSHGSYLVPSEAVADGHYAGRVHFSMPGPWRIITVIERPGQSTLRLRFTFRVSGR